MISVPKSSVAALHTGALSEPGHTLDVILSQFEAGDEESVSRGIRWLSLIMHAGTGIPSSSVTKIGRYLVTAKASIRITAEFIKLLWFQAVNVLNVFVSRAVIIDVIGYLNEIALQSLRMKENSQHLLVEELKDSQAFIKYSVVLTCFAYNCPLSNITDLNIVPYFGDHIAQLSQSKRASIHTENPAPMHVDETTPIIQCMLEYLKFDQLNVRVDVLKSFYALIHWGFGIGNKSDFISKCSSSLTAAIWEMLPPSHDHMSDINLSLLMRLMNSDPCQFQACVYEVFENANWEVRYQGLDNVYGLFTKMDAAFQTKWLPMLSYLGPVFSYFVGSLWDREEYVRSKAFGLIRTFGTLHLRSAFRCWEAYFLSATDQQKTPVIKMMIQLNALFPDWQVIQWESLLEGLETMRSIKSDGQSVDILESYMRSSANRLPPKNDDQTMVETENARVLMLTLALQMLANHVPVDTIQISRLKYILVDFMGFSNCQRYAASGEWIVSFGDLSYDYTNALHCTCILSASRGLKKVLDSFAPLPAETVASMTPEALEQNRLRLAENSSPGVHFIDVVLKLFNSGVDLTKLNHMLLKIWLETTLIVMYKHNIVEREYEHSIVNCMKQIIDLLTKDISEENKLLILEILKCLLKRSDHLTAMVLSKQIMALGKLMTKLRSKMTEPVFLKAKEFLKSAFLRFALAGLFVLMFKNQTVSDANNREVDLFFVLGTVIDPEDVVPDDDINEIIYLRDQPVRDVLDKLMKQQMERSAFSTVIHNMCRYVEVVHSHPYSETILNDYALFLNTLVKHTSDWKRSDWDVNPLFTMSAILLKEHPYHFTSLLPQIQVLFRQALQNCTVRAEGITKLMASFSVLSAIPGSPPENVFVQIIMEEVKAGLMHRQKLHKDTLQVLLQLLLWDSKPEYLDWFTSVENSLPGDKLYRQRRRTLYFEGSLHTMLEALVSFLRLPPICQQFTKKDFKIYKTSAQLLVSICMKDQSKLTRILELQKIEETNQCLRCLDWFLLSALHEESENLTNTLDVFEDLVTESVMQTFSTIHLDFDAADIHFSYSPSGDSLLLCFLTLKVWVLTLLQREALQERSGRRGNTATPIIKPVFWMLVWPTLRSLLGRIDSRSLALAGNIGCSVWNMFLSLLQFLFVCRNGIVLEYAYEWSSLLNTLHDQIPGSDKSTEDTASRLKSQVANVLEMFTTPPVEIPMNNLVDQLFLELRDVMRLQAETVAFQTNGRPLQAGSALP
ncbi:hypothetical protein BX666DRAFT_929792 [Dichotomocladium elegans]|nr:hypothetical protein BX666DRAFT_929792 [Dichotomocladium elegans]